jgi:hypothetical protein
VRASLISERNELAQLQSDTQKLLSHAAKLKSQKKVLATEVHSLRAGRTAAHDGKLTADKNWNASADIQRQTSSERWTFIDKIRSYDAIMTQCSPDGLARHGVPPLLYLRRSSNADDHDDDDNHDSLATSSTSASTAASSSSTSSSGGGGGGEGGRGNGSSRARSGSFGASSSSSSNRMQANSNIAPLQRSETMRLSSPVSSSSSSSSGSSMSRTSRSSSSDGPQWDLVRVVPSKMSQEQLIELSSYCLTLLHKDMATLQYGDTPSTTSMRQPLYQQLLTINDLRQKSNQLNEHIMNLTRAKLERFESKFDKTIK